MPNWFALTAKAIFRTTVHLGPSRPGGCEMSQFPAWGTPWAVQAVHTQLLGWHFPSSLGPYRLSPKSQLGRAEQNRYACPRG